MTPTSPVLQDVTTINYTLEWPHLENPSNTTFAGPTQIDICRCGPDNNDLGHIYTRYRCERPEIRFATPDEELWVLQAPLGQVNLLRPANHEEIQRRKEIHEDADPTVYAGKNFHLLSGPCPRGRYQALATLQFLESLSPEARRHIEFLSLLIQPYEEDCADDQGGRAYIDLAHYIVEELPKFKTLCLNIWGEETKAGSREFAMVLWKEGVSIRVSWDWMSDETEEYSNAEAFCKGLDEGVVKKRPVWEYIERGNEQDDADGRSKGGRDEVPSSRSRSIAHELLIRMGRQKDIVGLEEETSDLAGEMEAGADVAARDEQGQVYDREEDHSLEDGGISLNHPEQGSTADATTPTIDPLGSENEDEDDNWSDALLTPLSLATGEHGSWQML